MKSYWLSWYSRDYGKFELRWPWWVSGYAYESTKDGTGEEIEIPTICAAVRADSEEAAKAVVVASHDDPNARIDWRFVSEQGADYTPYNDRFQRNDKWMPEWPAGQPPASV